MISINTEIEIFNIGLCRCKALYYFMQYIVTTFNKKLELKCLLLVYTEKTEKTTSAKHVMPFHRQSYNENIAKAMKLARY